MVNICKGKRIRTVGFTDSEFSSMGLASMGSQCIRLPHAEIEKIKIMDLSIPLGLTLGQIHLISSIWPNIDELVLGRLKESYNNNVGLSPYDS